MNNENSAGPPRDLLSPDSNPRGHQWLTGEGKAITNAQGYAICRWCGCHENEQPATKPCTNAVVGPDGKWRIRVP